MLFELNSCLRGNLNSQNGFKRKVDIVFWQLMESNVLPIVFEIVKQGIDDIIFKKKEQNDSRIFGISNRITFGLKTKM